MKKSKKKPILNIRKLLSHPIPKDEFSAPKILAKISSGRGFNVSEYFNPVTQSFPLLPKPTFQTQLKVEQKRYYND